MADTLRARGSTGDPEITNGFAEHATAVDQGSKRRSAGVSLTKDPYIAARYAASSGGELICVGAEMLVHGESRCSDATGLQLASELSSACAPGGASQTAIDAARGGSIDLSEHGNVAIAAMRRAGATERSVYFAVADAEWRHSCSLYDDAIVEVESPPRETLRDGDFGAAKAAYEGTLSPASRDAIADFASQCEGKGAAWRAAGSAAAVRLEWREAAGMSISATRSMAHMALTLHDTYGFTDACATDGSFQPTRVEGEEGQAAWAVWRGVMDDGAVDAEGGSLPEGATIADAELTAIDACMRQAEERAAEGTSPRLLVMSDCTSVMIEVDKAWAAGSAWNLYNHHRRVLLERISLRRKRWMEGDERTKGGGVLIMLWTPAHRGVYPNHYADVVPHRRVRQ